MSIQQEIRKSVVSPLMVLWSIDGHQISGDLVWHFTASSDFPVSFGGITYTPFPIEGTGFEVTAEQPPRPKLVVSNARKYVQPFVLAHQELARVKVTRIRTLAKYLDGEPTADFTQQLPPDVYFVNQLTRLNSTTVEFELVSAVELPRLKLPMGQVLKDKTSAPSNLWAPGISSYRAR